MLYARNPTFRRTRVRTVSAACALLCASETGARGLSADIELKERLDLTWERELVGIPMQAGPGECHVASVRLAHAGQPVAVQLDDVETWDDAFVKSATLWFITDLEAREQRLLSMQADGRPAAVPQPSADLKIRRLDGEVELATSHFAVRLHEGAKVYDTPVRAADVPAPITAIRLADGSWPSAGSGSDTPAERWFGSSAMYGEDKITSYSARLTAEGPVFARVEFRYTYEDGNVLELTAQLAAGDNAVYWDMHVRQDRPENGWRIVLDEGLPALLFPVRIEFFSKRECVSGGARAVHDLCVLPLTGHKPGLITQLTPWEDWWNDYTQTRIRIWAPEVQAELVVAAHDPGAWVEPKPPGTMREWDAWQHKLAPLKKDAAGEAYLEMNLAAGEAGGVRRWSLGARRMPAEALAAEDPLQLKDPAVLAAGNAFPRVGRQLNTVNGYVLDWPRDPNSRHPRMFVSADEIETYRQRAAPDPEALDYAAAVSRQILNEPSHHDAHILGVWLATGRKEHAETGQLLERLRRHLGLRGEFDRMRHTVAVAALYDALIDTELVPEHDKPYLRAQMAYLAYRIADPSTWSVERGYRSGNPNMSVSHLLNQGLLAALLRDHPEASNWAQAAINRFKIWMEEDVGPAGEWAESAHYVHVSTDKLLEFAVAAKRSGFADLFEETRFRELLLYIAKMVYTPPDPQREGRRVTAPMGRRPSGVDWGLSGMAARATADSDPVFSRNMQFVWQGTGHSRVFSGGGSRWGGFQYVFPDPDLPAENPAWQSERFPWWGTVLRHGYGTAHEHYVSLLLPAGPVYAFPASYGSVIKYFSRGLPVGGTFAGGYNLEPNTAPRQELMQNRVTLARDWRDADDWYRRFGMEHELLSSDFAALPHLDYQSAKMRMTAEHHKWPNAVNKQLPPRVPDWPAVERRGQPPLDWQRQLVFVKDTDPAGMSYLVFRDTVSGGQPTMWQFWTLSEKIGTPEEAMDREAFLADAPGMETAPARTLEGDRFTAAGQFEQDVEYYIAAPQDTPRHTLRYGYTGRTFAREVDEYQDLLLVRLADDGHYFIAVAPRWRQESPPEFAALGEGRVMRVDGEFGRDHVFVSPDHAEVEADGIEFTGTAASVQSRAGQRVLSLGAAGSIRHPDGYILDSPAGAAELRAGKTTSVSVFDRGRSHLLTLKFPYEIVLASAPEGVEFRPGAQNGTQQLHIPEGIGTVEFRLR